jgi:hypothetical protein
VKLIAREPLISKTAQDLDRYLRARRSHPRHDLPNLWLGSKGKLTDSGVAQVLRRRCLDAGISQLHPGLQEQREVSCAPRMKVALAIFQAPVEKLAYISVPDVRSLGLPASRLVRDERFDVLPSIMSTAVGTPGSSANSLLVGAAGLEPTTCWL